MLCPQAINCGGCRYRDMDDEAYRLLKQRNFAAALGPLQSDSYTLNPPEFIADGGRRRATLNFFCRRQRLLLGFNTRASHQIADIRSCPALTPKLNAVLPFLRKLLEALCREPCKFKKGRKTVSQYITGGDVFVCEAFNGVDIVLEYDAPLELNHRLIIAEISQTDNNVIRLSHRRRISDEAETIIEKSRPFIKIGSYDVAIPAGTFLQPSVGGQEALGRLVLKYMSGVKGEVADMFCGLGTFSYLLATLPGVSVSAFDSSKALLQGFKDSVNANQIKNIRMECRNLFKYPLLADELGHYTAVVFDPPRAGAAAVCRALAAAAIKPQIIVAVSCNPATFVNDANTLISGGYNLKEITMVDQFVRSDHSELVACFTKR